MAEKEKRRATTFVTSRGAIINIAAPSVYIAPGVTPVDVTSPAEMREALREELREVFSVELYKYFIDITTIDCAENGTIVIGGESIDGHPILYKSADRGETWTKIWEGAQNGIIRQVHFTSSGILIVTGGGTEPGGIFRSADLITVSLVQAVPDNTYNYNQNIAEDINGNLVVPMGKGAGVAPIRFYRSTDGGLTWALVATVNDAHVHNMVWDKYYNRWLFCTGDVLGNISSANTDLSIITNLITIRTGPADSILPGWGRIIVASERSTTDDAGPPYQPVKLKAEIWEYTNLFTDPRLLFDFPHREGLNESDAVPIKAVWVDDLYTVVGRDEQRLWLSQDLFDFHCIFFPYRIEELAYDEAYVYVADRRRVYRYRKDALWNRAVKPSYKDVKIWDNLAMPDLDVPVGIHTSRQIATGEYHCKTISLLSTQNGDLDISILDPDGNWRTLSLPADQRAVTANVLKSLLVTYDALNMTITFDPVAAATVTSWVTLQEGA